MTLRKGADDCFEANVLAIRWGLGDALLADRERSPAAGRGLIALGSIARAYCPPEER